MNDYFPTEWSDTTTAQMCRHHAVTLFGECADCGARVCDDLSALPCYVKND